MGRWFQRNQALTIGISTSGTSVGGVVFPLMIEHLLPKLGFGWTMRTVVLLIAVLVVVANIALRAPPAGGGAGERRKPPPLKGVKARLVAFKERKFTLTLMGLTFFSNGYFLVLTFIVSVASLRGWKDQVNAIICLNAAR
jgi:MFS family permease